MRFDLRTATKQRRRSHRFQSRSGIWGPAGSQSIDYPELKTPQGKKIDHCAIIEPITTNICYSDQHIVHGSTTAPPGLVRGHEITGEVTECGSGVEFISKGDLVSEPFNVACWRRRNCKERCADVCLNVNPSRAGGAYGYVDLGGPVGGQAEYVVVLYADWNLLGFPGKDQVADSALAPRAKRISGNSSVRPAPGVHAWAACRFHRAVGQSGNPYYSPNGGIAARLDG